MPALQDCAKERALTRRHTRLLNDAEERVTALRKETTDLKSSRDQARQELERIALEINLDEKF
jgi:hypothetical protein